jgi:hypothetical protein
MARQLSGDSANDSEQTPNDLRKDRFLSRFEEITEKKPSKLTKNCSFFVLFGYASQRMHPSQRRRKKSPSLWATTF